MKRLTPALLLGSGALAMALAIAPATAAFATDITNPADNPYPITVTVDGQTYHDGQDTLPGYDDYACTVIPGVSYDFAHNKIDYPDGQVAPWTEWDRIPGYKVWLKQQQTTHPSPSPSPSTGGGSSSSSKPHSGKKSGSHKSTGGSASAATTTVTTDKKSSSGKSDAGSSKSGDTTTTIVPTDASSATPATVNASPPLKSTLTGSDSAGSGTSIIGIAVLGILVLGGLAFLAVTRVRRQLARKRTS